MKAAILEEGLSDKVIFEQKRPGGSHGDRAL